MQTSYSIIHQLTTETVEHKKMQATVNKCEILKCIRIAIAPFFLSLLIMPMMTIGCWASTVFINEFHYDNIGADVNERIEIAGPAGTRLHDWQLIFYNGSNGENYLKKNLAGVIVNQYNGYGTLSFTVPSIQNGPADAIALVDSHHNVIEFISYEGSLIAVNGLAAGLQSTDVGIVETGTSDPDNSIQRQGIGLHDRDFYWQIATASPNAINQQQTFEAVIIPLPNSGWLFMGAGGILARFKCRRSNLL